MRDLQDPATLSNHWLHTRNEQISGSSPLVGSLFFSRFAAKSLDLEGSLRSEKGAIYCNCTATQSRFFHEARSNRFRLTTAGPLRADATDLVAWAIRQEPESLLPALVRRLVLASGVQPLWIYRRGLWLRWVPFSIVRRANRRRLSGTPQAYRGDLDPGEQRDDEQIVGYARQQEQQYR